MKELEDRIRQDGIVREGNVLKVDSFLNHKCDVSLYDKMGAEWARLFAGKQVDKDPTIESSGIGIACVAFTHFGNVPVVFARKTESKNLDGEQNPRRSRATPRAAPTRSSWPSASSSAASTSSSSTTSWPWARQRPARDLRGGRRHRRGHWHRHREGLQLGGKELRERGYQVESLAIVNSMDAATGDIEFA